VWMWWWREESLLLLGKVGNVGKVFPVI
jgi:hypothetical protein